MDGKSVFEGEKGKAKLFTGWYAEDETLVKPGSIVKNQESHTLYAHWVECPVNESIINLTVTGWPDENDDGISDSLKLNFTCESYYEKFSIPLTGLKPGQQYTLSYTTENNAEFGNIDTYENTMYGSYISKKDLVYTDEIDSTKNYFTTDSAGKIIANKDITNNIIAGDLIAVWQEDIWKQIEQFYPQTANPQTPNPKTPIVRLVGGKPGKEGEADNNDDLKGPHKDRTITFTVPKGKDTLYWVWEFGLIKDGTPYEYTIENIKLEPVVPEFKFSDMKYIYNQNEGTLDVNEPHNTYDLSFDFTGASGLEAIYFPITGLTAGTEYTIKLDHSFVGSLFTETYDYGFGISQSEPEEAFSKMDDPDLSWLYSYTYKANDKGDVTLTFKATGEKMFWVWNMSGCLDKSLCKIRVEIKEFSAEHEAGGKITYYKSDE